VCIIVYIGGRGDHFIELHLRQVLLACSRQQRQVV
jgi:hypothetical protein